MRGLMSNIFGAPSGGAGPGGDSRNASEAQQQPGGDAAAQRGAQEGEQKFAAATASSRPG